MHRIDTKNYVTDEQGRRLFTDGDPHKPAEEVSTWIDADWLNAVQEEICRFIESQGVELKKGDYTGIEEAIGKMIEDKLAPIKTQLDLIWEEIGRKAENDER